jgi:hypothetical protein
MSSTYRPLRFESLVGSRAHLVDRHGLQRLVDNGITEAHDLEFKSAFYGSGHEQSYEMAKDISALANGGGGVIVIGVKSSKPDGRALALVDLEVTESQVERLYAVCADRVAPLLSFEVITVSADGRTGQLLIVVPPSEMAPHAVTRDRTGQTREPLTYWVRNGITAHGLGESEVANRYRDRFSIATRTADRVVAVLNEASLRLWRLRRSWFQLALVPTRSGSVRPASRTDLLGWLVQRQSSAPPSPSGFHGGMTATVGFRRIVLTNDMPFSGVSRYQHHVEVLDDGAVTVGMVVGLPPIEHVRVDGIESDSEVQLVDQWSLEMAVLGALSAAANIAADYANAGGDALVICRLLPALRDIEVGPSVPMPFVLCNVDRLGMQRQVPGSLRLESPGMTARTFDLDALSTDPCDLVSATHMLTADLLSDFGQDADMACGIDGRLDTTHLGPYAVQARAWAAQVGVPIRDTGA